MCIIFDVGGELKIMKIQMRCPDCKKLYQTEVQVPISIKEQSSLCFTCEQCHQQFSLSDSQLTHTQQLHFESSPESFTASGSAQYIFAQTQKILQNNSALSLKSSLNCPKCHSLISKKDIECQHCGIILAKAFGGQPHLDLKWQNVVQDFENMIRHQVFIKSCEEQGQLIYALEKYRELYEVLGDSQICASRISELEGKLQSQKLINLDHVHQEKNKYTDYLLPLSPYILSLGLISLGLLKPGNRNFIGFGVMLFILVTGIRFFWLGPKKFMQITNDHSTK